ncbi:MAG: GIY-YIG nuclease family protein [Proteobacteria bacterium]|nr:GIY-YIG nuclease family protein [Pseudomonadota bacterium]
MWVVYILRCSDQTLYTGITSDLERRLQEHNHDNKLAAAYTRSRRPVTLIYHETYTDRATATKREAEIKKLSRQEKEQLIENN